MTLPEHVLRKRIGTGAAHVYARLIGAPDPARPAPRLTAWMLAGILGFVAVWRLAILTLSVIWGRLGIATPWPPDIDVMHLWRYSVRWDSGWYLGIVRYGYEYIPDTPSSVAFFPLFPVLISLTDRVLPGSDVLAALVVVHLALICALIYIFQIVRLDDSEQVAWRTLLFVLVFPTAFFYSAVYTEALFLLGLVGSLYHARRGQWGRAALFAAAASATKIAGFILLPVLLLEVLRQRAPLLRRPYPLVAPLGAALGGLTYFVWLQWRFGDFSVFFDVERAWHRQSLDPVFFLGIQRLLGSTDALYFYPPNSVPLRTPFLLLDTTLIWVFLAAGVYLWWRVRPSYGALVAGLALLPALSGSPQSVNRYVAVAFPAFILLARISWEPLRNALAVASTLGLALTTYLFVQGYWAG